MSKYDGLDARTELEQLISQDMIAAFSKHGLIVTHNGTARSHAPSNISDITIEGKNIVINVEVTNSRGASQDREYNSIKDHLQVTKNNNPAKHCYCVFVSPETGKRMLDSIKEHNYLRREETDMKIMPLFFDTLELLLTRIAQAHKDVYPFSLFLSLFNEHSKFIDDQRIKKLVYKTFFPSDKELDKDLEIEETENDQYKLEALINDLSKLENNLRDNAIATGQAAIDNIIYLVFTKLYEEKRESEGRGRNRFRPKGFEDYKAQLSRNVRDSNRAIHALFDTIKQEKDIIKAGMFEESDNFAQDLTDDVLTSMIFPVLNEYIFEGTKIDALGAVYEVLARRAQKEVRIGQFFTPENIVSFMVKLAELYTDDLVLDPACGTGRFLIWAMDDMIRKAERMHDKEKIKSNIKEKQLYGSEIDRRIVKIAKMNMWFHNDGSTNIIKHNGLLLNRTGLKDLATMDNQVDVVLTNPPLGDINYQTGYNDEFYERMKILPTKNITEEKRLKIEQNLKEHEEGLAAMLQSGAPKAKIERKRATIARKAAQLRELEAHIVLGDTESKITGNLLKGGSLFINSIYYYLKDIHDRDALPEWRGGKLITIIDEGVLNTDEYRKTRDFIKEHFFIKAIISLTKDTFVPVANTATKTSILYLIKKDDTSIVQCEPIFYAHVERVGMNTKRKVCENHLDNILDFFLSFKKAILASYEGFKFISARFANHFVSEGEVK